MRILEIDGKNYTVDLSWHTASGPGVKKDISSFLSSEGYSFGTVYSKDSDEVDERNAIDQITGIKKGHFYQAGATDDDEAKGTHSLAHILAELTTASAIFCLSLNDGEKWVLAINDKRIVTTTDCALTDDEARVLLVDLYEALAGTHSEDSPLVCLLDDPEFMDVVHDHDQDYVELISGTSQLFISGLLDGNFEVINKKAAVKNLEGNSGLKLILGAAVLAGGYYGYSQYQNNLIAQERLRQQAQRVVQTKEPEGPSMQEILKIAVEEEKKWLNEALLSRSSISFLESSISAFNDIPDLMRGWESTVFTATKDGIQVSWNSVRGTTLGIDNFLQKQFDSHSFNARGDVVNSDLKIDVSKYDSTKSAYNLINDAPGRLLVIHELSKRDGISWSLSDPKIPPRPVPISKLSGQPAALERQMPYLESEVSISGSGIPELRNLYSLINEANAINISRLVIDTKNKNWEIKGTYYEIK